ncbi:nucleotidyltransferase domain-containing protein [Candidatus Woesearchaeota archaeon]|nr:nucleotidyltransferase domain-containing protein [Candidatus Woesearchaeota archaeon]
MVQKIKKIELIELNEAYQKVLYWFFSFPEIETGLNDLCSDLKISKTTAKIVVETLIKEEFLIRKVYGKAWRLTCNQNHFYNFSRKVSFNLSMIYDAYYNGLRDIIFNAVGNPRSIILFGSYRKGDDTNKSDIDIAVEVFDNKDLQIIEIAQIQQFGYRTNVPVNLHIFSRNKIDINLFSNIANGIILEGFLEVNV